MPPKKTKNQPKKADNLPKPIYVEEQLRDKVIGTMVDKIYVISRKDNKPMSIDEVVNLCKKQHEKVIQGRQQGLAISYSVLGLLGDKFTCLKNMSESDDLNDNFLDYYEGRVKDLAKFKNVYSLEIRFLIDRE
jgi:hypothetical protein